MKSILSNANNNNSKMKYIFTLLWYHHYHIYLRIGMVGACILVFALSVLYEGLKFLREYLLRQAALRQTYSVASPSEQVLAKQPAVG
jgi:hypothetical protein